MMIRDRDRRQNLGPRCIIGYSTYDGMVVPILDSLLVQNIGFMHEKKERKQSKVTRTKEVVK